MQLLGAHEASSTLSNAAKGSEREIFVDQFLSQVLPNPYRFGSGDAIDVAGSRTGQLDLVVEYPYLPSLPAWVSASRRLYLSESIAAVVEVKSDIANQWDDAHNTAQRVHALRRQLDGLTRRIGGGLLRVGRQGVNLQGATITGGLEIKGNQVLIDGDSLIPDRIPVIAVGYKGWASLDPLIERVRSQDAIDGILVIDAELFVSGKRAGNIVATGESALWGCICALHAATQQLEKLDLNPMNYMEPEQP
jgi:hypothetical protein